MMMLMHQSRCRKSRQKIIKSRTTTTVSTTKTGSCATTGKKASKKKAPSTKKEEVPASPRRKEKKKVEHSPKSPLKNAKVGAGSKLIEALAEEESSDSNAMAAGPEDRPPESPKHGHRIVEKPHNEGIPITGASATVQEDTKSHGQQESPSAGFSSSADTPAPSSGGSNDEDQNIVDEQTSTMLGTEHKWRASLGHVGPSRSQDQPVKEKFGLSLNTGQTKLMHQDEPVETDSIHAQNNSNKELLRSEATTADLVQSEMATVCADNNLQCGMKSSQENQSYPSRLDQSSSFDQTATLSVRTSIHKSNAKDQDGIDPGTGTGGAYVQAARNRFERQSSRKKLSETLKPHRGQQFCQNAGPEDVKSMHSSLSATNSNQSATRLSLASPQSLKKTSAKSLFATTSQSKLSPMGPKDSLIPSKESEDPDTVKPDEADQTIHVENDKSIEDAVTVPVHSARSLFENQISKNQEYNKELHQPKLGAKGSSERFLQGAVKNQVKETIEMPLVVVTKPQACFADAQLSTAKPTYRNLTAEDHSSNASLNLDALYESPTAEGSMSHTSVSDGNSSAQSFRCQFESPISNRSKAKPIKHIGSPLSSIQEAKQQRKATAQSTTEHFGLKAVQSPRNKASTMPKSPGRLNDDPSLHESLTLDMLESTACEYSSSSDDLSSSDDSNDGIPADAAEKQKQSSINLHPESSKTPSSFLDSSSSEVSSTSSDSDDATPVQIAKPQQQSPKTLSKTLAVNSSSSECSSDDSRDETPVAPQKQQQICKISHSEPSKSPSSSDDSSVSSDDSDSRPPVRAAKKKKEVLKCEAKNSSLSELGKRSLKRSKNKVQKTGAMSMGNLNCELTEESRPSSQKKQSIKKVDMGKNSGSKKKVKAKGDVKGAHESKSSLGSSSTKSKHYKSKKEKVAQEMVDSSENSGSKNLPNQVPPAVAVRRKFEGKALPPRPGLPPRPPKNLFQKPITVPSDYKAPKHPKTKEEKQLIKKALGKQFVFQRLPNQTVDRLSSAFEKRHHSAGERIVEQGTTDDGFYVVSYGECEYEIDGNRLGVIRAGDSFGEDALIHPGPREASVIAITDAEIFKVDQSTFRHLLESEAEKDELHKRKLLEEVDFLKSVSPEILMKLASLMTPQKFKKGEVVVKDEDFGKAFYLIDEGEVQCHYSSAFKTEDFTVGPGQCFGKQALMERESHIKGHVVALKPGKAYSIDHQMYRNTVGVSTKLFPIERFNLNDVPALQKKPGRILKEKDVVKLQGQIKDHFYSAGETIIDGNIEREAAVYFIRQGNVQSLKKRLTTELSVGMNFGSELFQSAKDRKSLTGISPYSVTARGDCVCGVLSIQDYYDVFKSADVKTGDMRRADESTIDFSLEDISVKEAEIIQLESLDRQVCLGEGNFGQVWLCVQKGALERHPYVLKIQSKSQLVDEGQAEVCIREKNILQEANHPFIVKLYNTYQDKAFVYMLMEFVQGGELFSVMNSAKGRVKLKESQAKFYALAVADVLAYLHSKKYVYRDLKPENILIDAMGYPKLIDFGFAKKVLDKTYTLCGTPGYLPPEVILNQGHNGSADHWQLGVLIYEMVSECSPFFYEDIEQIELFRSIAEDNAPKISKVSSEALDLINKLLEKDPSKRLGSLARGEREILNHEWFKDLDLSSLKCRLLQAPWKPSVKDPLDTSNFDDWSYLEDKTLDEGFKLSKQDAKLFDGF